MRRAVGAALVCLAAIACGLDWSVPSEADAGAGAGTPDAGDGGLIDGGPDGTGGDAVADATNDLAHSPDIDTGPPVVCNGITCAMDEICTYPLRDCGGEGALSCVPRAGFCGSSKVCGCDGLIYDNECAAAAAGTSAARTSWCPNPPSDSFECDGIRYCFPATEVCVSGKPQAQKGCFLRGSCSNCTCLLQTFCGTDAGGSCDGLQAIYCDK